MCVHIAEPTSIDSVADWPPERRQRVEQAMVALVGRRGLLWAIDYPKGAAHLVADIGEPDLQEDADAYLRYRRGQPRLIDTGATVEVGDQTWSIWHSRDEFRDPHDRDIRYPADVDVADRRIIIYEGVEPRDYEAIMWEAVAEARQRMLLARSAARTWG